MLVWKAMPSITPVMSAMRRELSEIALMVCTTPSTTSPPRNATAEACSTRRSAWLALLAFCCTVLVSSSIDAAVSSSEEACSSVRWDRSELPCAICEDAEAMLTAVAHVAHDASQAFVHFLERAHQVARFVARGHLDVGGQIARGDLARGVHRLLQRPHDTARDQPAQQHADGHAQHRQRDHQRAHAFVQVGAGLHRHGRGLSLLTARSVIRSSSFCDETTTRFSISLDGRIGLGQRLRLGRAEEVLGLALPGVLDLDELGQQTLAFVGLEGLAGAVAQLVHGLHGIVELLAQRPRSCSLVAARYPVRARPA